MALKLKEKQNYSKALTSTLGATLLDDGCFFSVWAPLATSIIIHFYTFEEEPLGSIKLVERRGGFWFGCVEGVKAEDCYAIEAQGEDKPEAGLYFKAGRLLVDPYAKALNRPIIYNESLYKENSAAFIPKAVVLGRDDFDWDGVKKPDLERNSAIIYEAHVKGMTKLNKEIPPSLRGTYLGLAHPVTIAHLKRLGVTVVQLMPIAASMSEPFLVQRGLSNYWGYNPLCFMALDPRYATSARNAVTEFKTMVRELHRNKIAVILDVVYNHTAEGGLDGPVLSYKGLDAKRYYAYATKEDGSRDFLQYLNVTGCGNSFNVDSNISLRLVSEAMRYWITEMQVDGFRFDLAVTVGREYSDSRNYRFTRHAAFFKYCFCEQEIDRALLIAEPWDVGWDGYQLGRFPAGWSEQNDKFRDSVRCFWRGDPGLLGVFATRLMGSRDNFAKRTRSINASLNYVTYHDGFSLEDLVSYNSKHNELNLEANRDGANETTSYNFGVEGKTTDPDILKKRRQMKRNLLASVLISQGMPHILGGDEFSRTQHGNNNAYCQDNDLSYTHWERTAENDDLIDFIGLLCRVRLSSVILKDLNLDDDNFHLRVDSFLVRWRKSDGHLMESEDWNNPQIKSFLLYIGDRDSQGERWCFIINQGANEINYKLPSVPDNKMWMAIVDTSEENGVPQRYSNAGGLESWVAPNSIKVLRMIETKNREFVSEGLEYIRHRNRRDFDYKFHR